MVKKFDTTRRFGFELEFTRDQTQEFLSDAIESVKGERAEIRGYEHTGANDFWVVKTDSSCGYEIASRVMSGWKDLNIAEKVALTLRRRGAVVNESCGFHVHVEVVDLNNKQISRIIAWWVKLEGLILNAMPTGRKDNEYAKPLSRLFVPNHNYSLEEIYGKAQSAHRRSSLNVRNIRHNGTIEFRIAEGTVDPITVKNWIRFLIYFVDTMKSINITENLNWLFPDEVFDVLLLSKIDKNGNERKFSEGIQNMRLWLIDRVFDYSIEDDDKEIAKQVKENI